MTNRPIYETQQNLSNENAVAQKISKAWTIEIVKLKPLYHFDRGFIHLGEMTGFLEIKCRTNASDKYPDYMLSLDKYLHAAQYIELLGLPVYLAVQWTDALGITKLDARSQWKINIGGRQDRDDVQDMEPCVFIPTGEFKRVK